MTNVTYSLKNHVATITINDGKANSFSMDMLQQLNKALDQAEIDKAVVIFTGSKGLFSAGFDLKTMMAGPESRRNLVVLGMEFALRIIKFPYPVIMACSGHALALGAVLLVNGDYRIAAKGNFKLGFNEVKIGLGLTPLIADIIKWRINPSYWQRSILLAEVLTPIQALEYGYVDQLVNEEELLAQAQAKAEEFIKELDMPAFAKTKLSLHKDIIERLEGNFVDDVATL